MLDGILDEDLVEKDKILNFGIQHLGIALIFLGLFLLWSSYDSYNFLVDPQLLVLIPPTQDRTIFNFILGIISLINGFLLYLKKDQSYYLLTGIISLVFTYCFFLSKNNISFTIAEIFEGFIEYFFKSLPLLIFNVFIIYFLKNNEEKIANKNLIYLYIILGIIIGTLPFLLTDIIFNGN